MTIAASKLGRNISTSPDVGYMRSTYSTVVPSRHYGKPAFRDFLDQRILRTLKNVTRFHEFAYNGSPLTTVSYELYGTTSLWWVILQYSGQTHELEIPRGTRLRAPVIDEIDKIRTSSNGHTNTKAVVII